MSLNAPAPAKYGAKTRSLAMMSGPVWVATAEPSFETKFACGTSVRFTLMSLWLALYAATMSVRNESLSRDQNVSVPFAAGALDAGAGALLGATAGVLAVAGVLAAGADVVAGAGVELDAVVVDFLLDEHAELKSARARLADATPAHLCFAVMVCKNLPIEFGLAGVRYWLLGSQIRIGPFARLAHR